MKKIILLLVIFQFVIKTNAENYDEAKIWSFPFGAGTSIHSRPVVYDTTVFLGSMNGYFYAISLNSGKEIWKFKTKDEIDTRALIHNDVVYFESANKLYALDARTGDSLWAFVANDAGANTWLDGTDYHNSSPVLYKDVLYYGDEWGNMNGVDLSGKPVFQYTDEHGYAIRATPVIQDDIVYYGDWEGNVYAVSLIDTSLVWKYTMEGIRELYHAIVSEFAIKDNILYFGSQHDYFSPIDIKTGQPVWTYIDPGHTYLPSTPVFYESSVIIASTINTFRVFSFTDGNINWEYRTAGICFVTPVIVDSIVLVNTSSFGAAGSLNFINCNNGLFVNDMHFLNAYPTSPAIKGDTLLFAYNDSLHAFRLSYFLNASDEISITMDTVSIVIPELKKDEKDTVVTFEIKNEGIICDILKVDVEMKGDPDKKGIYITPIDKRHTKPGLTATSKTFIKPTFLSAGNYEVIYTISSVRHPEVVYKKKIKFSVSSDSLVSLEKQNIKTAEVAVFPNPAVDLVNFLFKNCDENIKLSIYSISGLKLHYINQPVSCSGNCSISVPAGLLIKEGSSSQLYFYQALTGLNKFSGKFMISGR